MNLDFKNFGQVLGGRKLAEEIRLKIENSLEPVVLDFSGIRTVSHSFADELIGKLAENLGPVAFKQKIKIINLSESNRRVFTFVISERSSKSVA
ncbi:MAG: hypothetical protein CL678_02920 [Bdellovibrionaceae bacterium]|nr:hypothetical protein [Pseudobdellovibrionaceae bacterium]|tara:strand:+ start:12886 stop:13167 length:282 start_codon:yes stop_codon:yes gene_type:complete